MKKIVFLLFIFALLGIAWGYHQFISPSQISATSFEIKSGDHFKKILHNLETKNLISQSQVFYIAAKIKNVTSKLKAGSYFIKANSSMEDILNTLTLGKVELTKVTIPEGKNIFEIAQILQENNITDKETFLKLANNPSIDDFPIAKGAPNLEGYLFPNTYYFSKEAKALDVINLMIQEFQKQTQSLEMNSSKLSPYELLILASIVEKETSVGSERNRIAGVFYNRLRKSMPLQSDPTTIYGVFDRYKGNITKKHLKEKNPYNTYQIPGLPIGPICNPGLDSIKAVLNPEQNSYLYFVSKNDGTHDFSKTYKEHQNKVWKYQIKKR